MTVVEHEPQAWFLLESGGDLFLDGRYSQSYADYSYPIRLSAEEARAYRENGRAAVGALFGRIQYTAAFRAGSASEHAGRRVSAEAEAQMHEAILRWNAAR